MMKAPPFLPEETLLRVLRVAYLDGLSVLLVAVFFAVLAAVNGDFSGMATGLAVAGAGAIELHGAFLLRSGDSRGMQWIAASQPYLLATLLVYCALQLMNYDPSFISSSLGQFILQAERPFIEMNGISNADFLRRFYGVIYLTFAVVSLFYQGGMTIYYVRRRAAVRSALDHGA